MLKQLGQKIDESIELKSFNKEHPSLYMNELNVEKVLRVVYQQKNGLSGNPLAPFMKGEL